MARILIPGNLELELVLRVLFACVLGSIIGLERSRKHKAAGVRTYIIVAIGAAIFTIVSKYGFLSIAAEKTRVDVSRVAHTIVTGVGFLGAGIIVSKGDKIQGLTTAAGVWVMAAIGIACGTGMYIPALCAAILILITQTIMREWTAFEQVKYGKIMVQLDDSVETVKEFKSFLERKGIVICKTNIKQQENQMMYTFRVRVPENADVVEMAALIVGIKEVKMVDLE